jgi:YidC/Oxa1 family membrane protein insertase
MPVVANVLQPLIDVAHAILVFFHDRVGLSWGVSIIGLTFVVRLFILPLTYKSIQGMRDIQRLKPDMDRIKERHGGDRQKMNEEMMALYQRHKVNPASSCLPIVLQIPFFISLFYLLRSREFKLDIRGEESFLFIPNLAEPATGWVLAVLIVLYVGTQLGASLVTAISADRNQRMLVLALPFVFVVFVLNFETGLLVYWITTNVWTVGQQLAVKKLLPPPDPLPTGVKSGLGETNVSDEDVRTGRRRKQRSTNGGDGARAGGGRTARANGARAARDGNGRTPGPPPGSPRKKKKRSGRRR